jgi:hypothetical protein
MRIYIDPETGRPGTPPEGLEPELTAEQHLTLSTDAAELYEEPSPVPGGGTMIDLQGRFQSVMHGTLGADGVLVTDCDHSGAEGGAR